jgi:DegV family protein with EDD domain
MRVKIISDSTCDLSPELLERYDIAITPLCVIKDGKEFHDGVDITPADIFAHVDGGGELCSTAAVSQFEYTEMFTRYAKEYDEVVQINIGSNFSCCYQNACLAAQEFDNVFVVDSGNLSTGQGLLVVAAAKLAQQGVSGIEIAERVRALAPKVEASFLIERLDYMRKGGRCSAVAALGANLLNLKPCIEVREGKMGVCKKYRGSFEKCIRQYVKERLDGREDIATELVFITHAAADTNVVAAAKEETAQYGSFEEVEETQAGCTVSCHCGPDTLGILFVRK